jgi:hypothetical protein
MSSSSPRLRDTRLLACLVALAAGVLAAATPAPVPAPLTVVATGASSDRAGWLIAETGSPDIDANLSLTASGQALRSESKDLLDSDVPVAAVVDAAATAAERQAAATGMVNLMLQLPSQARIAVIVDAAAPVVTAPLGPVAAAVRAAAAVPFATRRATSDALTLALQQLPHDRHSLLIVCTSASDAGGEPAAQLADRLRAANAVLAVVRTTGTGGTDSGYWSEVATRTGGIATVAGGPAALASFDQVVAALARRYFISFSSTEKLPAEVTVRAELNGDTVSARGKLGSGTAAIPDAATRPPAAAPADRSNRGTAPAAILLALCVLALAAIVTFSMRERLPSFHLPGAGTAGKPPMHKDRLPARTGYRPPADADEHVDAPLRLVPEPEPESEAELEPEPELEPESAPQLIDLTEPELVAQTEPESVEGDVPQSDARVIDWYMVPIERPRGTHAPAAAWPSEVTESTSPYPDEGEVEDTVPRETYANRPSATPQQE